MFSLSGLGFSGWAILILSLAILTMVGSMIVSPGGDYRVSKPLETITIQVLNGCGIRGAAESLAGALLPGDGSLVYDVIEKSDAKLESFDKTVVVDRRGSDRSKGEISEAAAKVAERMGIGRDSVILLRLEDNVLDIDVTVIAGADYATFVDRLNKMKEELL